MAFWQRTCSNTLKVNKTFACTYLQKAIKFYDNKKAAA